MSDCSTHAFDVPLKSCPFCGGEAELATKKARNGRKLHQYRCSQCHASIGKWRGDIGGHPWTALEAWNSRAERTCECVVEYAKSPLDGKTIVLHRCSSCNELMRPHMNYCPNCGARVEVGE